MGYGQIAAELKRGKSVMLKDVEVKSHLLTYLGRQVILYIPDHGGQAEDVIAGRNEGHRFHLADCMTLQNMRSIGRYERYEATTGTSGIFSIVGHKPKNSRKKIEGKARLRVCRNCLMALGYKDVTPMTLKRVAESFDLEEFFREYEGMFKEMPKKNLTRDTGTYTSDREIVSRKARERAHWRCEECGVDLPGHRNLLHTHHRNGCKNDNRDENLAVFCALCHSKQEKHSHMEVSRADVRIIQSLRLEGGFRKFGWRNAKRYSDSRVEAILKRIERRKRVKAPRVPFRIGERLVDCAWISSKGNSQAIDYDAPKTEKVEEWTIFSAEDELRLLSGK